MRYGYFDNANREYVIDRVDVPVSWTNYLGVRDLCTVISHNAGGYSFYKNAEHQRITRFRQNGVPLDRPGHYVYLRDDETGEYWSISWQPVGKDLEVREVRVPPRPVVLQVLVRLQRHPGRADTVHSHRRRRRAVGRADQEHGRQAAQAERFLLRRVFLPPHRDRQPEPADEPVRRGSSYADGVIEYDFFYEPVDLSLHDGQLRAGQLRLPARQVPRQLPHRDQSAGGGARRVSRHRRSWAATTAERCTSG